jgi:hypothetical protein
MKKNKRRVRSLPPVKAIFTTIYLLPYLLQGVNKRNLSALNAFAAILHPEQVVKK